MRTKQKERTGTTMWLVLAIRDEHTQLTLRLPKRWVLAGIVVAMTLWGGPELAQLLIRLL